MSAFLYFVETDKHEADTEQVNAWGLGYAVTNPGCRKASIEYDGGTVSGLVIGCQDDHDLAGVAVKPNQEWQLMPTLTGSIRRWVGWSKDSPPTPEDLLRADSLPGYWMTDACGREWLLPVVREPKDDGTPLSMLPKSYAQNDKGELIEGETIDRYRPLWDATSEAWDAMVEGREVDDRDAWAVLCALMGANYRVTGAELSALRCFSKESGKNPSSWVAMAMNYPKLLQWWETIKDHPTEPLRGTDGETLLDTDAA